MEDGASFCWCMPHGGGLDAGMDRALALAVPVSTMRTIPRAQLSGLEAQGDRRNRRAGRHPENGFGWPISITDFWQGSRSGRPARRQRRDKHSEPRGKNLSLIAGARTRLSNAAPGKGQRASWPLHSSQARARPTRGDDALDGS